MWESEFYNIGKVKMSSLALDCLNLRKEEDLVFEEQN